MVFLLLSLFLYFFFFFKQKTAYEMRISDWSSDVCSSDLWLGTVIAFGALKWIGVWLILLWRPLRMALTPRSIKAERVRARAIDLFKVGTEGKTTGRTGVLLYLSLKEHRDRKSTRLNSSH